MKQSDLLHIASSLGVLAVAAIGAWAIYDPHFVKHSKQYLTEDKCYGIAKAGENDCGSSTWSHTCGGKSTIDYDPTEWKFVARGTCEQLGGSNDPP